MVWVDRLEKVGRLVLWLSMASAVGLAPVIYIRQRASEAQQAEEARNEARRKAEAAEKSDRLSLASMGSILTVLSESNAEGRLWFTNVSPRSGVVCVAGVVTNPTTRVSTESLATCKSVSPYASNVEIGVMFAGGDLSALCRGVACKLSFKEIPDATSDQSSPAIAKAPFIAAPGARQ